MQRAPSFILDQVLTSPQVNAIQDAAAGIQQIKGTLVGCPYVSCVNNANDIKIGGIHGVLLVGHENENDNSAGIESTYTPAGLANSTWYHLYAVSSGGVLTFAHATDAAGAPDNSLVFRSVGASALDQRRLCSFRVNASGRILPFRKVGGLVLYQTSVTGFTGTDWQASTGSSTTYADVDLSKWLPPHARVAVIEGQFQAGTAGARTGDIITKGDTGSFTHGFLLITTQEFMYRDITIITDSSQKLSYRVGDATAGMTIYARGYHE